MGVNKSDSPSFWTSDTYLPTAVALFAQSSNSTVPANSASTKIAAQVSSNSAWAVTNEFDNSTITTTEDLKSAFSALESGKVAAYVTDFANPARCSMWPRTPSWVPTSPTTPAWTFTWSRSCSRQAVTA